MNSCSNTNKHSELVSLYTKLAENPSAEFGWGKGKSNAQNLGYSQLWLDKLPDDVWESAAAVGNPFKISKIVSGQSILDIGCGAGADACVASLLVGDSGSVIGVDCTPAMINKARQNAAKATLKNIEFHQADIAVLPIPDDSIDVVISNGAINLSENKDSVFKEIYRVLKPTGRLQFADMVRKSDSCCEAQSDENSWANCVQGTLSVEMLLKKISDAGFINAELIEFTGYQTSQSTEGALIFAERPGN